MRVTETDTTTEELESWWWQKPERMNQSQFISYELQLYYEFKKLTRSAEQVQIGCIGYIDNGMK